MTTLAFDDLISLDTRPRGAVRVRRGERSRRDFLFTVGKGAIGVGLASVGYAAMRARAAGARYGPNDPYDTTSGHNCSGSASFYASNPTYGLFKQCGPSWVCNTSPYLGGCNDSNGWHRHYWPGGGDGWKFRPDGCIAGTNYDAWKWDVPNAFLCSNKARFRCHDGYKLVGYQAFPTIASHKYCV